MAMRSWPVKDVICCSWVKRSHRSGNSLARATFFRSHVFHSLRDPMALATGFHGWSRSWIVTSALSKARTRTPHHQRLANAGRNGRHSMKRVGREGYQGSPRFGRRVYLVRGVNLQFAALIIGRLGKLQYQRELAPPRCTAMVDVPVI